MSSVVNKNIIVATCLNCGKPTDISLSSEVQKLRAAYITLKEERADVLNNCTKIRAQKNGTIQAMNVTIGKLLNIMTNEQRKKAIDEIKILRAIKKSGNEVVKNVT